MVMPGVNSNGVNQPDHDLRGSSYDNLFLVDGVVVGENLRASPTASSSRTRSRRSRRFQEASPPSTARFTGGVVSTLTKSGSNEFHGSFRQPVSNPNLDPTRRPTRPEARPPGQGPTSVYEVTLGGRIIPDHIWFFGGGRLAKRDQQEFTVFTNVPFDHTFDEKRYEGKLTLNPDGIYSPFYASYVNIKNDEGNNFLRPDHGRGRASFLTGPCPTSSSP